MNDAPWWVALVVGIAGGAIWIILWHRMQMRWARKHPIGGEQFKARHRRPETPEERIDNASKMVDPHWSRGTIKRGIAELQRFYKERGMPVPSTKELEREAELLLNASINGEGTIE